jgi:hypothetical protein
LECDHGKKAEHNMEVLNGSSVININIKCVILMYMGDNWILNYPSIKNRIYSARSLVMKIMVRKSSVGLAYNLKIHAYIHIYWEHSAFPFLTPRLLNKVIATSL